MATHAVTDMPSEIISAAIADTVAKLRTSLQREGADMAVEVDEANATLIVSLIRNRIICEGCIQPEKLVRTMLSSALRASPDAGALRYKIDARGWEL